MNPRKYGQRKDKRKKEMHRRSGLNSSKPHLRFKKRLFRFSKFIRCNFCKTSLSYDEATVDHVVPKSLGGADHWTNFGIACRACNSTRGNKDYHYFKLNQPEI